MECGQQCLRVEGCKSVTLRRSEEPPYACYLNSATKDTEPVDFAARPGFEYYDFTAVAKVIKFHLKFYKQNSVFWIQKHLNIS